jgi:membrane-associated protein
MEFFKTLLDSNEIINTGGMVLIFLIVYAENGLFFGFFLPGDYLLFSAGLFCGTNVLSVSIFALLSSITLAAVLGSFTGFYFGKFVGRGLFYRKESVFFKYKYLVRTRYFYIRYGGKTLIISRFLPVVRTFSPIMAGAVRMDFKKFTLYNFLGAVIWVFSLVLLGYFLGREYPGILNYLEWIIIAFLAVTSTIVIKGFITIKNNAKSLPQIRKRLKVTDKN